MISPYSCPCGATTTCLAMCDECDGIALTTAQALVRLTALENVIRAAHGAVTGTGGGHDGWWIRRPGVEILVTNDDGFCPRAGDEVLVGLYADEEFSVPRDQHAFSWDAAAAGLADVLSTL